MIDYISYLTVENFEKQKSLLNLDDLKIIFGYIHYEENLMLHLVLLEKNELMVLLGAGVAASDGFLGLLREEGGV